MSSLEIRAYVRIRVTKFSPERHYIPNWNFMLKRRRILILTCQPGISLLCSSSSYKISMWRTINSKLEFYAKDKKIDDKLFFLVGTVWCLGLLQETVWLIWNYFKFLIQSLIMIYCTRMETNSSQINCWKMRVPVRHLSSSKLECRPNELARGHFGGASKYSVAINSFVYFIS